MNRYEVLNQERKIIDKTKRVAAYCRVSTDNEDQANSFESQQRYFKQYIERNPDWELYKVFVDEGIYFTRDLKWNKALCSAEACQVTMSKVARCISMKREQKLSTLSFISSTMKQTMRINYCDFIIII